MFLHNVKKAVFIGAHTDDEMIVAGTLHKLVKAGVDVKVIIFSYAPIPGKPYEDSVTILRTEFALAMDSIGIVEVNRLIPAFEPRTLPDKEHEIRQLLYNFVIEERPDAAFILSSNDDHQDHAAVGKSAERVMKNRVPNIIRCHYPWNFINTGAHNLFVKLTPDEFESKLAVIRAYKSQHFRYDYENLFTALSKIHGLATRNDMVEAFEILYCII